jgi:DNA-directed RNA polymerase specialized sigma24 family protein
VVAEVLADACDRGTLPNEPQQRRLQLLELAAKRMHRHARQGGVVPILPDPTESSESYAFRLALAELRLPDRLALALFHVAGLDQDEIARVMHASRVAAREQLDDARNEVQALVERNGAGGETLMGEVIDLPPEERAG